MSQSAAFTDKGRVIAGFTKTSRDGVFYQPKGRCYIDPRIVTALSLPAAPVSTLPCSLCGAHNMVHTHSSFEGYAEIQCEPKIGLKGSESQIKQTTHVLTIKVSFALLDPRDDYLKMQWTLWLAIQRGNSNYWKLLQTPGSWMRFTTCNSLFNSTFD